MPKVANEPRNHHYAPKFFLRNFAVDEAKTRVTTVPSIVHIALETLEGPGVEERRMKKLIPSIEQMVFAKHLEAVVIHSFQPVNSMEQVMVIAETSSEFWRDGNRRAHVPFTALLPAEATAT